MKTLDKKMAELLNHRRKQILRKANHAIEQIKSYRRGLHEYYRKKLRKKCPKCRGRNWLWWFELDEPLHSLDRLEKHLCDWCKEEMILCAKEDGDATIERES